MVFKTLKEAKKALKDRYKEDLADNKKEVMDNELYDASARIELIDNYIYYGIYDINI